MEDGGVEGSANPLEKGLVDVKLRLYIPKT
jgi:hypothetical protein